jgi:hypothetical protein
MPALKYVHSHVPIHTHIHTETITSSQNGWKKRKYIHTYTHIHTYIHTYTHTHTQGLSRGCCGKRAKTAGRNGHACIHTCTHTHTHTHRDYHEDVVGKEQKRLEEMDMRCRTVTSRIRDQLATKIGDDPRVRLCACIHVYVCLYFACIHMYMLCACIHVYALPIFDFWDMRCRAVTQHTSIHPYTGCKRDIRAPKSART